MNQKERVSFQVYVFEEFLHQVLKVAQSSFAEAHLQRLNLFLSKLLGDGNDVFQQVEFLAQIKDTTELTIFFSDLLEKLDYDDPIDLMSALENLIDDFVTLVELLFEEQEYVDAVEEYIKEAGIVEAAVAEDEIEFSEEIQEEVIEEKAEVTEEKVETPVPVESIDDTDPDKEYKLTEFIFEEIIKKVDKLPVVIKDKELKLSLKQYVTQLRENFRRNPNLLVNQPHEIAIQIAHEIIDNLLEPDETLFSDYKVFVDKISDLINTYASENKEDLLKSFTGVLPEMVAEKEAGAEVKERKVLQKRIYSYFEKETNFHLDEIEKSILSDSLDSFWVELEALRTLVMIHGYEAIETACLRLQREKNQWSPDEIDIFLNENKEKIVSSLRIILKSEIEKDVKTAQTELDILDDIVFACFEKFESVALNDELKSELKDIWFKRFKERELSNLKEWVKIDLDNVVVFDYDQDFIEGLHVIDSFLDKNPFTEENWGEFYHDWESIFVKADADLLTERVNSAFEISTGAVLSFSDQETLSTELFSQILKRFKDLAPYYQLTDDEQAFFQQQIVELSVFITDENYLKYVNKLIENLNEYFYDEISEKFVRNYFIRISAEYDDLNFPLDDFTVPAKGEEVQAAVKEADSEDWIDEVEEAVSEDDQEEFIGVFQSEAEENLVELKAKIENLQSADVNSITEIENLYHSINTSAGFIGLKNTSLLSGEFEKVLEEVKKQGLENLKSIPVKAFSDSIKLIEKVIKNPGQDEKIKIDSVLKKLQAWQEKWQEYAKEPSASESLVEGTEVLTDDPELLEVFQNEASENVNVILENLQILRNSSGDIEAIRKIDTSSHNITTAAKMLGFSHIGDLMVKLESFGEEKLEKNEAFLDHQIDFYQESIKGIEDVMTGKINENQLKDLVDSFDERIELRTEEIIDINTYINKFMYNDVNNLIGKEKTEIQVREYVAEISKLAEHTASFKLVEELIDIPFTDWSDKTSVVPSKILPVMGKVSAPIAMEKTDILLDSSAALVDSQLDMQDQLNRNKELLTELNSTQNLLNYLKAELDELNQKEKKTKEVKKRQKELSRILDDAVAKMTHLVQEMGRVNTAFESRLTEFDSISDSFQRNILEARKMPASDLMERIDDYVEEIREKSGKNFEIIFSGEDVELDKSTVDFLEASFKELLTNSIFHGIETPDERKSAGKDEKGKIEISLSKNRNLINLEFNDDGRGLDLNRVAEIAEKKGLGKIDNDEELVDLLFSEKFSYSDEVNDYVGDGNGLAELKKSIEIILGDISINSEKGNYTKISLMFPQHLKISESAIVQAENDFFAIPLGPEDEVLKLKKSDIEESDGNLWIDYQSKKNPVFLLNSILNLDSKGLMGNKIEAIRFDLGSVNLFLVVDAVKEVDTIVIRPLQKEIKNLTFIAGVAQLPNFQTVLVLETDILIKEINAGFDFKFKEEKIKTKKKTKRKEKSGFAHGVVLDSSNISTEIVAGVLRENKIETEVITDVSEWNEDHDRADILFIENVFYDELRKEKGLWLDSPRKIVVLHDGELSKTPSGADQLLSKPFAVADIEKIIKGG